MTLKHGLFFGCEGQIDELERVGFLLDRQAVVNQVLEQLGLDVRGGRALVSEGSFD